MPYKNPRTYDPLFDFDEDDVPQILKKIDPKLTHICAHCGRTCQPVKITPGRLSWEIVTWSLSLLIGLIYSLLRLSTQYLGCPHCRTPNPVPLESPRGQQLFAKYYHYGA